MTRTSGENEWIVHDGVTDPMEDGACIVWHMSHVVEADPSVSTTADLPIGQVAWRRSPGDEWVCEPWEYADDES
jgi:hypothetical protein